MYQRRQTTPSCDAAGRRYARYRSTLGPYSHFWEEQDMLQIVVKLYEAILNVLLAFLTIVLVPRVSRYLAEYIDALLAYIIAVFLGFFMAAAIVGAGFLLLRMHEMMYKMAKTLDDSGRS
jgi:hypothetical protein